MRRFTTVVLCIVVASLFLVGCGGGGSNSSTPQQQQSSTPPPPQMTGNWGFTGTSQVVVGDVPVGGKLFQSGNTLSGTVHFLNSCVSELTPLTLSGTIDNSGAVSITATSANGDKIQVSGTASADRTSLSAGTYSVTGGCGSGDHGTVTGNKYTQLSGTYTGQFKSVSNAVVNVSASLTSDINSTSTLGGVSVPGGSKLSGTVTFSNSPCSSGGAITEGFVIGDLVYAMVHTSNGDIEVLGSQNIAGSSVTSIDYQVIGGTCGGDTGTGSLSH